MMRIAVDARPVFQESTLRGVGKTLIGLYRAMAELHPDWQFDLYYQSSAGRENPFTEHPNIHAIRIDGPGDRFGAWFHWWFPRGAKKSQANLIHCHGSIAPRWPRVPLVTTIHDLSLLDYPTADPNLQNWIRNVRRAATQSQFIITASEFTRQDIATRMQVPTQKIEVVPWGPTEGMTPMKVPEWEWQQLQDDLQLSLQPGHFLLHFGMGLPRKNTARVIDAFAELPKELQHKYPLLILGLESAQVQKQFQQQLESRGMTSHCHLRTYCPEHFMPMVLNQATALLYLPLSEGFGIPILDAFSCGCPVLTSNQTSMPEVASDAALGVDPTDGEAIRAALHRLLTEAPLRQALKERGLARLQNYSWQKSAILCSDIFQRVTTP